MSKSEGLWGHIRTIFWGVLIALVIRSFLLQPFTIPSGSMIPTLLVGDYVIVSKFSYGFSRYSLPFSPDIMPEDRLLGATPSHGDVVVFRLPSNTNIDYIKRVVGLPGDRVQMRDGTLFVNGVAVRKTFDSCYEPGIAENLCRSPIFKEELRGSSHLMMDTHRSRADNTREFLVPSNHLFFMGDNRDNSEDSRLSVGFVPMENLVGRAELVLFSIDERFSLFDPSSYVYLFRWGRFFERVE